jgi:hypothetical protein
MTPHNRNCPTSADVAQMPLFDTPKPGIEARIQAVLAIRRKTNSSGQEGRDIDNIRAALRTST